LLFIALFLAKEEGGGKEKRPPLPVGMGSLHLSIRHLKDGEEMGLNIVHKPTLSELLFYPVT